MCCLSPSTRAAAKIRFADIINQLERQLRLLPDEMGVQVRGAGLWGKAPLAVVGLQCRCAIDDRLCRGRPQLPPQQRYHLPCLALAYLCRSPACGRA